MEGFEARPAGAWAYILRRLITAGLTLFGAATALFALVYLLPGDPAEAMLARSGASAEAVAALRLEMGLDRPLPEQYLGWISSALRGDLGRSLFYGRPVGSLIAEQFPYTFRLALAAFLIAIVLGALLGAIAARKPHSLADRLAMGLAIGGVTIPVFWSGLLLIWVFSVRLGWLPPTGAGSLAAIVMPAFALGFASAGPIARLTRASLIDELRRPHITAARARGVPERRVFLHHAWRNALIPVLTISGLTLSFLLGGTVVTETVFSRPGLGRLLVDAILWRDLPVIQGVSLVVAAIFVITNLVIDIASAALNPRAGWE